jgi:O-antigen ligase
MASILSHKIKRWNLIAFLAGLGTLLFFPTPFGRIPIFDLTCYLFSIALFYRNKNSYTKIESNLLLLSVLWFLSTLISNLFWEEEFMASFKAALIVFNVPCILIVAFHFLKRNRYSYLWYIVGYGISGILSLYIFHNGAYLYMANIDSVFGFFNITPFIEKKLTYPLYTGGFIYSILFPLSVLRNLSFIYSLFAFAGGSIFLLSIGSRLNFGTYSISMVVSFFQMFSNRILKKMLANIVISSIIIFPIFMGIFELYTFAAKTGRLGTYEKEKYEKQVEESEYGALGGRESSLNTAFYALQHPILGTGSSAKDRTDSFGQHRISSHSIIFGSWAINGIGGLLFWGYIIFIIIKFLKTSMILYTRWMPFLIFIYAEVFWHIFFSPFGFYRSFLAVSVAFAAISINRYNVAKRQAFRKSSI